MLTKHLTFNIYTLKEEGSLYQCIVTLTDAVGQLIETYPVNFNTTDKVSYNKQDGANQTQQDEDPIYDDNAPSQSLTCSQLCPSWYNIFCFIMYKCGLEMFVFFTVLFSVICFLLYLYCCIFKGRGRLCFSSCFSDGDASAPPPEENPQPKPEEKKTKKQPTNNDPESPNSPNENSSYSHRSGNESYSYSGEPSSSQGISPMQDSPQRHGARHYLQNSQRSYIRDSMNSP